MKMSESQIGTLKITLSHALCFENNLENVSKMTIWRLSYDENNAKHFGKYVHILVRIQAITHRFETKNFFLFVGVKSENVHMVQNMLVEMEELRCCRQLYWVWSCVLIETIA